MKTNYFHEVDICSSAFCNKVMTLYRKISNCHTFNQQQRLRAEKESKKAQLDGRHHYLLEMTADMLGLRKTDVEDHILDQNFAVSCIYVCILLFNNIEKCEAFM